MQIVNDIIAAQKAATKPINILEKTKFSELNILIQKFEQLPPFDHLRVVTPTNLERVKETYIEAVRKGKLPHNPQFEYDTELLRKAKLERDSIRNVLSAVLKLLPENEEQQLLLDLFVTVVKDKLHTTWIATGILDKDEVCAQYHVDQKYGRLPGEVIGMAEYAYDTVKAGSRGDISAIPASFTNGELETLWGLRFGANEIVNFLNEALKGPGYRFDDYGWIAMLESGITAVTARELESRISVPVSKNGNGIYVSFLLNGHVEEYVRLGVNGHELLRGFGSGKLKDDNEIIYRGRSAFTNMMLSQKFGNPTTTDTMAMYHVLAADLAANDDFNGTFEKIFQFRIDAGASTKDESVFNDTWANVYRAKRGGTDPTSKTFCMSSCRAYFEGYHLVKELTEAGHGHLSEVGIVRPSNLVKIASYVITPDDIPFRNLGLAEDFAHLANQALRC